MEIDEIDGNDGHIYRLKNIDEIQEILITESGKRNELSTKYNRGVNIICVIDSWSSLDNSCCTSRDCNGSSNNCYGITSSCRKSSY